MSVTGASCGRASTSCILHCPLPPSLPPPARSRSGTNGLDDEVSDPQSTSNASSLTPLPQPFSPMALNVRRTSRTVVGRPAELAAIQQEIASAREGRLVGLTIE